MMVGRDGGGWVEREELGMSRWGILVLILVGAAALSAMVVIPARQGYVARAQVSGSIDIMRSLQGPLAAYYSDQKRWPVLGVDLPAPPTDRHAAAIVLTSQGSTATLTATMKGSGISPILANQTVQMRTTDGGLTWSCFSTTIEPHHLTGQCRNGP